MVYLDFWKKTFTYRGRDKKREFWLPFLVNILIGIGLFVFVKLTHSSLTYLPLYWAGLAFIPSISSAVRRMRDSGTPMTFFLILLMPILGLLVLLIILSYDSDSYSRSSGNSRNGQRCPYCHYILSGHVLVGSIQETRVRQNRCPHCGKTLPSGLRVQIKR